MFDILLVMTYICLTFIFVGRLCEDESEDDRRSEKSASKTCSGRQTLGSLDMGKFEQLFDSVNYLSGKCVSNF